MFDPTLTYEEMKLRLEAAEEIIQALKDQQVDAIIGDNAVILLNS